MSGARELLIELYRAAIAGADVESLTADAVANVPLERRHRVWVLAIGKAAHAMGRAAVTTLQRSLAEVCGGLVIAPEDGPAPCGTVPVIIGDHPIPGSRSFAASARLRQVLTQKRGADLGIVLVSGGASSLMGAPLRGLDQADYASVCEAVLRSGLEIARMNAIRKRFSLWSAGRMALALAPARTYCFAVSDVPGDDLATIGSGPCVPDPTYARDVLELLGESGLREQCPASFMEYVENTARGALPETPKSTHPAFAHMTARVIANNSLALEAVAAEARAKGYVARVCAEPLAGDAVAAGRAVAGALLEARTHAAEGRPHCVIWGGETTVTMGSNPPPGGRCQALALSAAGELARAGQPGRGIALLVAGTDGRDGSTDVAGAIVNGATWQNIRDTGVDPGRALERYDAHTALASVGALHAPGLTGTNVMDVAIGLID